MQILFLAFNFFIIPFIQAQDCQNPLLNTFGLAALAEPESGGNLPYCNNLQNDRTCCSADTISSFQNRINELVDRLNIYASAKDLYLAQLKEKYSDDYKDFIDDLDDYSDELGNIREQNAQVADQIKSDIDQFRQIYNDNTNIDNQFYTSLREYQTARLECFRVMLQVQSSAWCLACDPNYAEKGVSSDGTITFSGDLCQTISNACYPFLSQTANFNPLIQARESYWRLKAVSNYLDSYSDGDSVQELTFQEDPYNPLFIQQRVSIPEGCTEQDCSWQCRNLFSGNILNDLFLAAGAGIVGDVQANQQIAEEQLVTETSETPIEGESINSPVIEDANASQEDLRAWAPALAAAGLNLNLRTDPGDVFGARDDGEFNDIGEILTEAIADGEDSSDN